ncbi:MAG: DUF3710 domain-containing protein [Actinomycetia bacterium]|nr:DUF3710 domain-containing protein [Actinomycetes bacterium]MCH9800214.1 DUF3710 domain-containing protein [Actinomycetes bacterium]
MLGRKRKKDSAAETDEDQFIEVDDGDFEDTDSEDESEVELADEFDRSEGPFDLGEVEEEDAATAERLDLGALQVPLADGLEVRVEVDPQTQQPLAVTLVLGEGAVQVRVFAAPKSGGGWAEARGELRSSISGDGGVIDEESGTFGTELRTTAYLKDGDGNDQPQRMRFIGVDGPRWMVQGVLLGDGTDPSRAAGLETVFRSLVVARGDEPMPPGNPLAIELPEQVPEGAEVQEPDEDSDD